MSNFVIIILIIIIIIISISIIIIIIIIIIINIYRESQDTVSLSSWRLSVRLTQKVDKSSLNFNLLCSLNSLYENPVGCKNLKCFEFFKLSFLIFKNDAQRLNILLLFLELIFNN
jgi:hypothetical protein